jgi:hypothetical protein
MRHAIPLVVGLLTFSACGSGPGDQATSTGGSATPAATKPAKSALIGAETKARCAGFGPAQAAEFLGVAAGAVTEQAQDITPTARGCDFTAGDKKVGFSLGLDESVDDAKRAFESLRETYVMAARIQESAMGKKFEEGAYSDILSLGDEAIWSITNGSLAVRHKNLTIMVMSPSDKRTQVAIARKILDGM